MPNYVSTKRIKWKFITELAPWIGGFYERLEGLVKRPLRKTLVKKTGILKEIEATINSRPLV